MGVTLSHQDLWDPEDPLHPQHPHVPHFPNLEFSASALLPLGAGSFFVEGSDFLYVVRCGAASLASTP